ncbi:MAG: RNHCP domain-containing protein [Spirochaetales bacterium]|nr:RNHCP domain-containing protein [Spirochaetales bacterium]
MSRTNTIRNNPGEAFICRFCGKAVSPLLYGGDHRNHCPHCLCSVHVDILPGDRRARCRGIMKPIGLWMRESGEAALIHRCENCGVIKTNRIGADDNERRLFMLAASPLAQLPFPTGKALEALADLSMNGEVFHG